MKKQKALFLLADGFEEIEAVTAIDILRRAGLDVTVAGVGKLIIKGAHNLRIKADTHLSSFKGRPDIVVVPGGTPGVLNLAKSKDVSFVIKKSFEEGRLIAGICAAPAQVLAPCGVLAGKKATCYPGGEAMLKKGRAEFVDDDVVVDGNVVTSKGPGTAFDFGLKIVELALGKEARDAVAKRTLYEK